jgi:hypothetical protein
MTLTAEGASKVAAGHLERDAYVYVRQSTLAQVGSTPRAWNASMSWRSPLRDWDGSPAR